MTPKPKAMNTPFENNTTNTFGYQSQDQNNPWVQQYMGIDTNPDPGAARRNDLAQQSMNNRWNSSFTGDIPQLLKMQNQESERRQIGEQGAADQAQATYMSNQQKLGRAQSLLPQLTQTGGTSKGYNSQIVQPQGSGLLNSLIGGAGSVLGGALSGGFL